MPSHPAAPPAAPTSELEVQTPPKAPDLTVSKIIAGAGAAATAAVLGSYLGAGGTVAGAAIGSVASTVATSLYQRSLDRTRETVVTRIRLARPSDPDLTIPMQRDAEPATVVLSPVPPRPRLRRAVIATVAVFVLALVGVTGLEFVKGSTVTRDEAGTSVGRVLAPEPVTDLTAVPAEDAVEPTEATEPTAEPEVSAEPTVEPTPDAEPSDDDAPPSGASVLDPLLPDAGGSGR